MSGPRKTAIVTGASQGIGAGIAKGFVEWDFNVVANALQMTQSTRWSGLSAALTPYHVQSRTLAAFIVADSFSAAGSYSCCASPPGGHQS